jgi:ketosteroid isomerase-like protein
MSDSHTIPEAVQRMVEATNAADRDAFAASFTDDAYLVDWGREFHGQDGVRSWDGSDNIGRNSHFEVLGARREGEEDVVRIRVSGDGFNGDGDIRFTVRDGLIARMIIAPE